MLPYIPFAVQTQAPAEASPLALLFPFVMVFAIMYLLVWRPQQKHRRQLQQVVDNLKKGDRVITSGGIIGSVTSVQKDYVVIKTGDNEQTKMEVLKSAISGLRE